MKSLYSTVCMYIAWIDDIDVNRTLSIMQHMHAHLHIVLM